MSQLVRSPCLQGQSISSAETPCPPAKRPFILASAIAASSMAFIDGSAVTVALPAIRDDLNATLGEAQWVLNIYVLVLAAFTLIGGAAADRFGRRRVYLWSVVAFALTSLVCAVARTPELLIVARAFQGLAGAFLAPAALAVISATYPPETRGRALGAWASASALTTAGGPVLGGLLVETAHWGWVFAINLPVAAAAIAMAAPNLPESRAPGPHGPLDLVGALLAAAAFGLLALGLVSLGGEGGHHGADAQTSGWGGLFLLPGLAMLAAFLAWERRAADPMMPLSLYKSRVFSGVTAITALLYAGLSAALFTLPFELMDARDWTATQAGLAFLPFTLGVGLLSQRVGRASEHHGPRRLLLGGAVIAAVAFLGLSLSPGDASWPVFAAMGVLGVGFALSIAPMTAVALGSVPEGRGGVASGVNNAAARAAGLAGGAVAAALLAGAPASGYAWAMALAALAALGAALLSALTIPAQTRVMENAS